MKNKLCFQIISLVLVLATLLTALPLSVFAEEIQGESENEEYIKSVKLVQAKTADEAKAIFKTEGYTFLSGNLNEGTGEEGVWLGYQTTTDPTEAIYDMKLMNMKGGYTLTTMEEALAAQESALSEMAQDLSYLIKEFVAAYEAGSVPAQSAYMALNFFRLEDGETDLQEQNGLGYRLVNGGLTTAELTEIILLCNADIVDSIVKILTMGIQLRGGNWMRKLSEKGPYEEDRVYMDDEAELKRRAEQLLVVMQLYSRSYNAMDKAGLIPDKLDQNFEPDDGDPNDNGKPDDDDQTDSGEGLPAGMADMKSLDEGRYKIYKVVFDELAKYGYGEEQTLKDFVCSLEDEGSAKALYPLVSVLSDGEFAALSYGCFLEMASGAMSTVSDYDYYNELYASLTEEVSSVYLYAGVDKALLKDDAVIGFTDAANRHMASTGEMEFYEKETEWEETWDDGIRVAKCVGVAFGSIIGVSKIMAGTSMIIVSIASSVSTTAAASMKAGVLGGIIKYCSMTGSLTAIVVAAVIVALVVLVAYLMALDDEDDNEVDWDEYPMPQYIYDVKEVSFSQASSDGVVTESLKRPVYVLYEGVMDDDKRVGDLNARSGDASQWLGLYVSYDRQGDDAKPIKASDLLVKTGNGELPGDDYTPLTRFGEVVAHNLNQWDEKDSVNGVFMFYKQDKTVAVDSGTTYYISDVYLQSGESSSHCIDLLRVAGYTPININLSPSLTDGDLAFEDPIYTYLGYKVTNNPASAIRDLRVAYGSSQGQVKLGAVTYAECGSNGSVTLYATKYECAGTPLLEGGLRIFTDRFDAPAGYEPVNFFGGGSAASINVTDKGVQHKIPEYYIYFLPEKTFTSGTSYLGGITYVQTNESALLGPLQYTEDRNEILTYLKEKTGKSYTASVKAQYVPIMQNYSLCRAGYNSLSGADVTTSINTEGWGKDSVTFYRTYNPYRAIYDVSAVRDETTSRQFVFENVGYAEWNTLYLHSPDLGNGLSSSSGTVSAGNLKVMLSNFIWVYNNQGSLSPMDIEGKLFVAGNPSTQNVLLSGQQMKEVQPIRMADIVCLTEGESTKSLSSAFKPVQDVFSNGDEAVYIKNDATKRSFCFYAVDNREVRPYVSGFYAIDQLSVYRAMGGEDASMESGDITDVMLMTQLANMGATDFFYTHRSVMLSETFIMGDVYPMNVLKFGYRRSAKGSEALRDVFLYFNNFSNDEPPREIYRGSVVYTVICEIPYKLTDYDEAPKPGIYLYGTTDSRAGNRITNIEISDSPFMQGFETVRSMSGRSLWSEIADYLKDHMNNHPMSWGREVYEDLYNFFNPDTWVGNDAFYIHIQREGDSSIRRPYIEKIYLANNSQIDGVADRLFDMGAEGYCAMNLNKEAGGDMIYVGYSYTSDPAKAIKEIRAYHKKSHPATLTDDDGRRFTLVEDLDVNKGAGGDYIYLYTTTGNASDRPISSISVETKVRTGTETLTWADGKSVTATTSCTKKWDSSTNSDLNKGAGGAYIYLLYTTVNSGFVGAEKPTPDYGEDMLHSRDPYSNQSVNGKYVGGLYVMDKETIRLEKVAKGTLSADSSCAQITDQEVFDRLKAMGATTVIQTPILVDSTDYFEGNQNKVFIGYSRTDKSSSAIRSIAIKAEILNLNEPPETTTANGKSHTLVAEAATDVTELPRAVNLIGTQGRRDTLLPRLYLYYSTSGGDPIYDICIDSDPIKNGWVTVRSANGLDPFADVYAQAYEQYELGNQSDWDNYDQEIVYTDSLFEWMDDVATLFDPEDAEAKPFYIHTKTYAEATIEEVKPYIGEIFVAEGDSRHEALSKLVAFSPDGFVDRDLNQDAGGNYVYMAYKRVEKARDALTNLVVYEGQNPTLSKRMTIDERSVKFTLAADVDLNADAGGKYLYLYTADSKYTGNPITGLNVTEAVDAYLKCGVERVTVKRGDTQGFTTENIDLNKDAGGDSLYLVMTRETTEGHRTDGGTIEEFSVPATCEGDGHYGIITTCQDCEVKFETILGILVSDGSHTDVDGDGDHRCDHCKKRNVSEHVYGDPEEERRVDATATRDGYYKLVCYCKECGDKKSLGKVTIPAGTPAGTSYAAASLYGNGSMIVLCSMAGVAILTAVLCVRAQERKQKEI